MACRSMLVLLSILLPLPVFAGGDDVPPETGKYVDCLVGLDLSNSISNKIDATLKRAAQKKGAAQDDLVDDATNMLIDYWSKHPKCLKQKKELLDWASSLDDASRKARIEEANKLIETFATVEVNGAFGAINKTRNK